MHKSGLTSLAICALLAGCAGITVTDGQKNLDGIPFYVKVPVATQTTLHATNEILVSFTVSQISATTGEATRSVTLAFGGPISLRDTEANRNALASVMEALPEDALDSTPR